MGPLLGSSLVGIGTGPTIPVTAKCECSESTTDSIAISNSGTMWLCHKFKGHVQHPVASMVL